VALGIALAVGVTGAGVGEGVIVGSGAVLQAVSTAAMMSQVCRKGMGSFLTGLLEVVDSRGDRQPNQKWPDGSVGEADG
jgi:hypothetical protein